jgi:uncharacterized membrane protein YeaQ/YmgE (transglycosylase-associated protein family)
MKKFSLGTLGNSIVGIIGGGLGGQLLGMIGLGGVEAAAVSTSRELTSLLSSLVGGGVVMAIVGIIKNAMSK